VTPSAAVLVWSGGEQVPRAWGVPLWLRLVRQVRLRGVRSIHFAGPVPAAVADAARRVGVFALDATALAAVPPCALCVIADAEWVLDDLVLDQLLLRKGPVVAVTRAADDEHRFAGAARLPREQVDRLDFERGLDPEPLLGLVSAGMACPMDVDRLPAYRLHLRRSLPAFAIRVDGRVAAGLAEHRLLDATQKGTNDLPAQYLHPPLEKALVRALVPLGITPNTVTAVTIAVAIAATAFLAGGWFIAGLLCAMAVGVLDGVDGKIARVTLTMTRAGDWFDHLSDNVYEVMWYLALGAHLSARNGTVLYTHAAWAIVAAYLLDRCVLLLWKAFREGDFHESSDWDRAFRRICGRRNNIVFLLFPFVVLGRPEAGLVTVLVWWTATLLVHAFRVGRALGRGDGREPASACAVRGR
jgi:phosphatidylglycerophosphate synthase